MTIYNEAGESADPVVIASMFILGATTFPGDLQRTSMALSWARAHGCLPQMQRAAMAKRAEHRLWVTQRQRVWQSTVSRRPGRGRHHDSWTIREGYVRCAR